MAIAGSCVQAMRVWLENGVVKTGQSGSVYSSVVIFDAAEAYRRIKAGEKVYLSLPGNNYVTLLEMVRGEKYPQEVVK